MISNLLLEAAIRSALLGMAVWIGLRVFAVRNVLAQKAAWGLVLGSALTMPLVLPVAPRLPGMVIPAMTFRSIATVIPQLSPAAQAVVEAPISSPLVADSMAIDEKTPAKPRFTIPSKSPRKPAASIIFAFDRGRAPTNAYAALKAITPPPDRAAAAPKLSLLQIVGLLYVDRSGSLPPPDLWSPSRY